MRTSKTSPYLMMGKDVCPALRDRSTCAMPGNKQQGIAYTSGMNHRL